MEILSNLVETINDYLIDKKLSPYQFALLAGLPVSDVYVWLNGTYMPSLSNLLKIADFLDVSVEYLLNLSDKKTYTKSLSPCNFKTRFKKLIAEKDCKLITVANFCGIESSTVSKWSISNRIPKIDTLLKLCEFFNCSLDYLVGRTDIR